jgi:hypothetical protein
MGGIGFTMLFIATLAFQDRATRIGSSAPRAGSPLLCALDVQGALLRLDEPIEFDPAETRFHPATSRTECEPSSRMCVRSLLTLN